jgi:hypothetical protein
LPGGRPRGWGFFRQEAQMLNVALNVGIAVAVLMLFGVSPETVAGITFGLWAGYMVENWILGK